MYVTTMYVTIMIHRGRPKIKALHEDKWVSILPLSSFTRLIQGDGDIHSWRICKKSRQKAPDFRIWNQIRDFLMCPNNYFITGVISHSGVCTVCSTNYHGLLKHGFDHSIISPVSFLKVYQNQCLYFSYIFTHMCSIMSIYFS